jgi:hypothetical protein
VLPQPLAKTLETWSDEHDAGSKTILAVRHIAWGRWRWNAWPFPFYDAGAAVDGLGWSLLCSRHLARGAFDVAMSIEEMAKFIASWGTDRAALAASVEYDFAAAEMFKVAGGGGGRVAGGGGHGGPSARMASYGGVGAGAGKGAEAGGTGTLTRCAVMETREACTEPE